MKKIILPLIIMIAVCAASAAAQKAEPNREQKMIPLAMAMALSVSGEMYDANYQSVLNEFQTRVAAYSAELKPVVELRKDAADYVRLDVAQTATKALRAKASKSDKWQMLVGERFGTIYAQIRKNKLSGEAINADDLKFSLDIIATLAGNAPDDIPADVLEKIRQFGNLKNAENPASEANVEKIIKAATNLLSTISN